MDKKELLGLRIKELRKERGFTQDYLAEKLNIEPRQLSKLETGKHYPSFETIIGILKTFDLTFEELMAFEHLDFSKDVKKELIQNLDKLNDKDLLVLYKIVRSFLA